MGADPQLVAILIQSLSVFMTVFTLGLGCATTHTHTADTNTQTHKHTVQHLFLACSYARLLLSVTEFWKETDWSLEKKVWPGSLALRMWATYSIQA